MLTEEQLNQRMGGIGSSEIASICGVNPWQSAHDVYCAKLGLATFNGNVKTRMGERVEDAVAEEYMLQTGDALAHFGTIVHPEHPWMMATPDRAVFGVRRLVEIKCVGWRSAYHWGSDPDAIPDYYRPQVEWQMEVCDVDETHVAAWIGGSDFRIYTIKRNRKLGETLRKIASDFWHGHVLAKVPPAVDGTMGARRMLNAMFPRNANKVIPADDKAETLLEQLRRAREELEAAEAREVEMQNKLRELAGDADGIAGSAWVATWKANKNGVRSFKFTAKKEQAA
jgi:putative phage-type endonuclease